MDLTTWLDVAIGLTLVYLGVSLFVTIINESIAQIRNMRGKELQAALRKLIDDESIRKILAQQPTLASFFTDQSKRIASYVDPKILGQLLISSLSTTTASNTTMSQISEAIDKLPHSILKTQLQSIALTAETKTEKFVADVSDWMNRSLTMLGERYKQNLQVMSFGVGLVVTVVLNINTIALTEHLYRDKESRNAAFALAIQITEHTTKDTFDQCTKLSITEINKNPTCNSLLGLTDAVQKRNESLGKLPIGWSPDTSLTNFLPSLFSWDGLKILVGWLLTALAVSLGAPFWFDMINKAVSVRQGMRKPE